LAIGIGFYEGAIIGTGGVYFTERVLRRFSKSIKGRNDPADDMIFPDDDVIRTNNDNQD
jgi:uncharacterized membrane protein YhiD involved in acid resistance